MLIAKTSYLGKEALPFVFGRVGNWFVQKVAFLFVHQNAQRFDFRILRLK